MSYSRSFLGKGTIYRRKRGVANAPALPMGNCTALSFAIAQTEISENDYENPGGGKRNSIKRITGVTGSITTKNHDPMILALGLRGTVTNTTSVTAITGEAHAHIALGSLVVFERFPDLTKAITVKKGATPIAAANYETKRVGVFIKSDAAGLVAGDDITVDYTPLAESRVDALTVTSEEFYLLFDGLNEADSGKPVAVEAHRIDFSPMAGMDLISDEFGNVELAFEVLSDDSIQGVGESSYFNVRFAG